MHQYTHQTHPRSRHIKIKVESNGEVVVVSPKHTPRFAIDRFVRQQATWIDHQLEKIRRQPKFISASTVKIFGKSYQKQLISDEELAVGVHITDDEIIFNQADPAEAKTWTTQHDQKLHTFLKHTAERYVVPKTTALAKQMGVTFGKITLRRQKTRWGSCSSTGNLNFNWQLVHFEPPIIDYVLIHELAHRKHMNHSKKFWELVASHDPGYKHHRGVLKRTGLAIG